MTDSTQGGQLERRVAIVTGGGSGIGRATCLALAEEGARPVVVDVDPATVRDTLDRLGTKDALGLTVDVRNESETAEMARRAVEAFGQIDILVAAAGILRPSGTGPKLLVDMKTEEWEQVIDTNLKGVFLSNRAVLPSMIRRRRGAIVNVSSVSGRVGRAYDSAYCASKFGIIGLSEALTEEVRQHNVRVQVVLPDAVDTPLWSLNGPVPPPPNVLSADRVAHLILYLLKLPEDAVLIHPVIAPFKTRRRKAKAGPRRSIARKSR